MLRVKLVNDLCSGIKLYWHGQEWQVESAAQSGLYDFKIKNSTETLWLDRVWVNTHGKGAFYFRVCNSAGEFVSKMAAHQFNQIVPKKG